MRSTTAAGIRVLITLELFAKEAGVDLDGYSGGGAQVQTAAASTGTNMQINIGDSWKSVDGMQINIGDTWKAVASAKLNIGDSWKTIF